MAGHRCRVAEAKIDVLVAVHVANMRPARFGYVERRAPGPRQHPRHRHAEGKASTRLRVEPARRAVELIETLLLLVQRVSRVQRRSAWQPRQPASRECNGAPLAL